MNKKEKLTNTQKELLKIVLRHGSRELITSGQVRTGRILAQKKKDVVYIETDELGHEHLRSYAVYSKNHSLYKITTDFQLLFEKYGFDLEEDNAVSELCDELAEYSFKRISKIKEVQQ